MVTIRKQELSANTTLRLMYKCHCGSTDYTVMQKELKEGNYPSFILLCHKCMKPVRLDISFPTATNIGVKRRWKSLGIEKPISSPEARFSFRVQSKSFTEILFISECPEAYTKKFDSYSELLGHLSRQLPLECGAKV